MSVLSEPPKASFRLSQLIYDTRYRSMTIQVVAMILLMLLFSWLVSNTITNLAAKDKTFDFGFIGQPAGYAISQSLIPYNEVTSTHGRAAVVGILNTILVAFLGCILATIIGVLVGVLRLSKNWLVSRLMAVYVESFRNVPLLLWIIAIYAVVTESLPIPTAFRDGTASMIFNDSVAITNRAIYLPAPIWNAGSNILIVIFLASVLAIFLFRKFAARRQESTGKILPVFWISLGIFVIPSVLAFYILGRPIGFSFPALTRFNFTGGFSISASLLALWLALSLYTAAFIAENVRAGILAVSKGQSEAAFALGLRPNRTMNLVILPQALRVIIPPLISQYLNLTKNSSLAIAVGYSDVRATLGGTTINLTGRELEGMMLLGLFYLVLSLLISSAMNIYNSRKQLVSR